MKRKVQIALFLFSFCFSVISCSDPGSKLPDYGAVPAFRMTDSNGALFESDELAGKVWVVDFIYTNCHAACPMMTYKMHGLQTKIGRREDVRLVSISVDPEHDTPVAMTNFARRYGGPTPQWIFLTGAPATVHLLAYTTFHVGDVLGKIEHSTKFILVDKRGHIRGYYSTLRGGDEAAGGDDMSALLHDIELLRQQR
ncbi:MAG: SCO family protein [Acidobacteriaceae bacterium]|nr:SCO family protein [Acidobacteriaceae bacterium]MBV8571628.1 SCO family protein [Acidobacteriaceae bacterium]